MLCTSGFVDDVTFGRNGPYGETWRLLHREATTTSDVAIPGRNLMSMNAMDTQTQSVASNILYCCRLAVSPGSD